MENDSTPSVSRKILSPFLYGIRVVFSLVYWLKRQYYIINGISIGRNSFIAHTVYLDTHRPGKIHIGENCYITRNVVILCHSDTKLGGPLRIWRSLGGNRTFGDVFIGDNVFIGVNSVILPGVKIGNNVIIGALSLVNTDIPEGKVAVGIPARVIGETLDHVQKRD
jgi:maltose O-acetyltransferase